MGRRAVFHNHRLVQLDMNIAMTERLIHEHRSRTARRPSHCSSSHAALAALQDSLDALLYYRNVLLQLSTAAEHDEGS